mmetsp:Transcript_135232/g.432309  ORF Transcript_135232/g.432309 Transcript_135232/m.432309 type:complete len:201 (+) Transcript_135232:302-904(+)
MRGTFPLQMFTIATELDIPMNRIGVPNSSFSAAYGVAKFFGSVATDYLPCAECHALGILLSGLDVAALSLCSGLGGFTWLWSLQAFGWPFLARMVVTEMPEAARAKYWGALSMAGSVGVVVAPQQPIQRWGEPRRSSRWQGEGRGRIHVQGVLCRIAGLALLGSAVSHERTGILLFEDDQGHCRDRASPLGHTSTLGVRF